MVKFILPPKILGDNHKNQPKNKSGSARFQSSQMKIENRTFEANSNRHLNHLRINSLIWVENSFLKWPFMKKNGVWLGSFLSEVDFKLGKQKGVGD